MLTKLFLKNYILIDELEIQFDEGLNVITGETGAGKSIIISAIDLVFSPRVSKEVIKGDKALIELTLSSENLQEFLKENDIDNIGDEVIIPAHTDIQGDENHIILVTNDNLEEILENQGRGDE